MGKKSSHWITMLTPALFESRVAEVDVYGTSAGYGDKEMTLGQGLCLVLEAQPLAVRLMQSICFSWPKFLYL